MKKVYSAPDIFFDSFTLNENIAGSCTRNITNQYSGSCGLFYGNRFVFTEDASGCRWKYPDGTPEFDGLCYHVPTADNKIFNS